MMVVLKGIDSSKVACTLEVKVEKVITIIEKSMELILAVSLFIVLALFYHCISCSNLTLFNFILYLPKCIFCFKKLYSCKKNYSDLFILMHDYFYEWVSK